MNAWKPSWMSVCAGFALAVVGCDLTEESLVDRPLCEQLCARHDECLGSGEDALESALEAIPEEEGAPSETGAETGAETGDATGDETGDETGEGEVPLDPCVEECVDHIEFIDLGLKPVTLKCVEAIRAVRECLAGLAKCADFEENFTLAHATEDSPTPPLSIAECAAVITAETKECGCASHAKWCEEE